MDKDIVLSLTKIKEFKSMPTWSFIMLKGNKIIGWFKISTLVLAIKFQAVYFSTSRGVSPIIINPWYITGFSDGEACFHLAVNKHKRFKHGYSLGASFKIHLHSRDLPLLEKIKSYFGVGNIYELKKGTIQYQVTSIKELKVILDHFDKYPLVTSKWADYILFKQGIELILNKAHLTTEGLRKFIALKASMNWGLSESLAAAFPDIVAVDRPLKDSEIPHPYWLVGFIDAEGCFMIKKVNSSITGSGIHLCFQITQHVRDVILMENIKKFLDCGMIYNYREGVDLRVTKISDIMEKIIPLLEEYPLQGVKLEDYKCFKEVGLLINNKEHLTPSGLEKIKQLKLNMDNLKPKKINTND